MSKRYRVSDFQMELEGVVKNVLPFKGTKPQRATKTSVDTVLINAELLKKWQAPPFQRPLRVNDRVATLSEQLKQTSGVLPGVITVGVLDGVTYLLDGQHRIEAFKVAGITEGFADVRTHYFSSMGDMGEEFVLLNSSLVKLRPDDILRGLEGTVEALSNLRKRCPFVGYDMIRRNTRSPIISVAQVLRAWKGSAPEVPTTGGMSSYVLARQLTIDDSEQLASFLLLAEPAWGRDLEYRRLWTMLNLCICMWLYRRVVIQPLNPRVRLTSDLFGKCLMELSADRRYIDWLSGRSLRELDRSPAYSRIKVIFARRAFRETGKRQLLPSPVRERGHASTAGV